MTRCSIEVDLGYSVISDIERPLSGNGNFRYGAI